MISIVIVNFNTPEHTADCINSILSSNITHLTYEIICIENNNDSNSFDFNNKVRTLSLGKNCGYSRALNYGISKSKYEYILVVNPDVLVNDSSINVLLDYYTNNKVGIIGPMIKNIDNTFQLSSRRRFPFISYVLPYLFRLHKIGFLNLYNYENLPNDQISKVDSISGAFMLFSRDIYKKIGNFDERFFLYFEDTDFCIRCSSLGYDVLYYPLANVKHHKYASTNYKNYLFVNFQFYKSFFKFYYKYLNYYLKF